MTYWEQWQKERQEGAQQNGLANTFVEANTIVIITLFRALKAHAPATTVDSVYELTLPVMGERGTNNPIVGMFVGHVLNLMIDDGAESACGGAS